MDKEKGGRGKMVTAVKPIRPTIVEFKDEKEMDEFVSGIMGPKKSKGRMNELMKKHMEQRKK